MGYTRRQSRQRLRCVARSHDRPLSSDRDHIGNGHRESNLRPANDNGVSRKRASILKVTETLSTISGSKRSLPIRPAIQCGDISSLMPVVIDGPKLDVPSRCCPCREGCDLHGARMPQRGGPATRRRPAYVPSHVGLFSDLERIIDFNAEVMHPTPRRQTQIPARIRYH